MGIFRKQPDSQPSYSLDDLRSDIGKAIEKARAARIHAVEIESAVHAILKRRAVLAHPYLCTALASRWESIQLQYLVRFSQIVEGFEQIVLVSRPVEA
jgi:hypothetical protein